MNYFKEILNTFSNQKSFFSSKRIERFVSFASATGLIVIFGVMKLFCFNCVHDLTSDQIIMLSVTLYGYSAYNTHKIQQETKTEKDAAV